jgi:hemoglobin-like flavoprotein
VVKSLDRIETMLDDLRALARRHDRYGVREEHYASVDAALLWTLEQGLGLDFTPDVRKAWATAYGLQHPHGATPAHTSITHLATPFGSLVPQR